MKRPKVDKENKLYIRIYSSSVILKITNKLSKNTSQNEFNSFLNHRQSQNFFLYFSCLEFSLQLLKIYSILQRIKNQQQ